MKENYTKQLVKLFIIMEESRNGTKKKNRFWLFTRNILLFLTAISFVWFLTHQLMTLNEKNKYSPIGGISRGRWKEYACLYKRER